MHQLKLPRTIGIWSSVAQADGEQLAKGFPALAEGRSRTATGASCLQRRCSTKSLSHHHQAPPAEGQPPPRLHPTMQDQSKSIRACVAQWLGSCMGTQGGLSMKSNAIRSRVRFCTGKKNNYFNNCGMNLGPLSQGSLDPKKSLAA